jgi:hypothetical protein
VITLLIEDNYIGDEGAQAIALALKANVVMTALDLAVNNIGDEGVEAIAEALKVNVVLTELWLQGNGDIGDAGAQAILGAVEGRRGFVLELFYE